jgi:hypothetical protein
MTNKTSLAEIGPPVLRRINEADRSRWEEVDYITAGEEASGIKFFSQWTMGKLAYEYVEKWGDCSKYARKIHVDANSLIAYRRVYKKIFEQNSSYTPDGYIPWGVIQIATYTNDPIGMIEELSVNDKVSIAEAHRYRLEKETGKTVPKKPKISLKWSEITALWQINISEKDFGKIDWALIGKQLSDYLRKLWER